MKKIHSRLASMLVTAATISTLAGCGSHSDNKTPRIRVSLHFLHRSPDCRPHGS